MSPRWKYIVAAALAVTAAAFVRTLPGRERGTEPNAALAAPGATSDAGAWASFRKPEADALRKHLTPLQYRVTQEEGTEPPFQNEYWNHHEAGLYVDVVSGEPLFTSMDKFDSGSGWPSFTRPLSGEAVVEQEDRSLGMVRVEARSRLADSHLGHVFDDGPEPAGMRYCINSAALRFIPVGRLEAEGYGEFAALFRPQEKERMTSSGKTETALLAGGCFWGMEDILRAIPGVLDTEVGYTGGTLENPGYSDLKHGDTGHAEAIRVDFDPAVISYEEILGYFFRMHDPTTKNRQGNDVGTQYRSAIFYLDEGQKEIAERVRRAVDASGKWKNPIVTEIAVAGPFYPAEEYHQDYLEKHPDGYTCHYLRD